MNEQQYTFARFWKCALQVNPHSYNENYRGQEHGMDAQAYAEALRDVCLEEEIQVVGLADHGSVADAETIRKVLTDTGIVVFPGFEVATTEKVHWVCLFPEDTTEQQLERYLGKLDLTDPEDGVRPSRLGGQELLKCVEDLGGFVYAAHVTQKNGLLKQKSQHLWQDRRLRAAQIPGPVDDLPYEHEYKRIALNQNQYYRRDHPMALINAKDVAKPDDLRDPRASCFIKMTRPCFESFQMAFKDLESRIRLADQMKTHYYSRIERIRIEGGYFDGLDVRLSDHLNTVIGGRGTGKSTLLECIRYALDVPHKGKETRRQGEEIVKENLGNAGGRVILELCSANNNMKRYTVIRRYAEPPRVVEDQGNESALHPGRDLLPGIEIYGQNEIYELVKSPDALTRVLDRFLPDSLEQQEWLELAYRKLKGNSERLLKALEQRDEIEQQIAQLPKLEEQVRQFKEQGLEEQLKLVPLLEKERQLSPRMKEEIERVGDAVRQLEDSLPDLVFLSDKVLNGLPHAELLRKGRAVLEVLDKTLRKKLGEIKQAIDYSSESLQQVVSQLQAAREDSEQQLEREFSKLPEVAGKDGKEVGRTYQRLLRQIEQIKPARTRANNIKALIQELEQERRNLLGEISDLRSARITVKQKAVKALNKRLKGKLRIQIVPDGLRQPLRDYLLQLPGVGERKTEWVENAEGLTILGLVAAIRDRDGKHALMQKGWGIASGLAETLTLLSQAQKYKLEAIDLQDRISLELNVAHAGEEKYRELHRLSTGQQCTAILHLLLLDNQDPLIMDQPEDNLDNAFIADRIIQELRSAKTERQFLFATHNANIPVFGDAEWIGVCSATEDHAEMPLDAQGSIDIPTIRDQVANILEGGKEAFMQRKEKYGFEY